MAQITYFFLSKCIYCSKADRMIRLVKEKHPEFKAIKIQKIEESLKPEIAEQYDYQLVPCFFVGNKKIFEGAPTEEKICEAFSEALKAENGLSNDF